MRTAPKKFLAATVAAQFLVGSVAVSAETGSKDAEAPANCQVMLEELEGDLLRAEEERTGQRSEMSKLAAEMPLLVEMADGSFVYLDGEEKLSQPIEAWFVSEKNLQDKAKRSTAARAHLQSGDEASCIDALKATNETSG